MGPILLTTDLSEESKRAFAPTVALARALGLQVTLLVVIENLPFEPVAGGLIAAYPDRAQLRADYEAELQRQTAALGKDVCTKVVAVDAADVASAICTHAEREQAGYIAMATHGRSGLRRLLLGSVAENVLRRAHVPVIVFPPPAAG